VVDLPTPRPGLVIRYAYLWRDEADRGRDEGVKDRPCVVILAVQRENDALRVRVAPITHSPPKRASDAVELPMDTKRRLGLDDQLSWISTRETNVFTWPGPDLRPVRRRARTVAYGFLPGRTFRKVRDTILANIHARQARSVERDD
jgi:mRNA-degrading endonuclease toxin of MazEF toxin-antitoxin module